MSRKPIVLTNLMILAAAACVVAGCGSGLEGKADAADQAGAATQVVAAPRVEPLPAIPAALRGCWETDGPQDPEEPGGPHRVVVTATTIEVAGEVLPRRVATAEFVERVGETSIEGRFSAPEGTHLATAATALSLGDGGDGGPLDMVRRAEGDAGSTYYSRCTS